RPVPCLPTPEPGGPDPATALAGARVVIAGSEAAAAEFRAGGGGTACTVIRHLPSAPRGSVDARQSWRARWALPEDALVVGMIGGVKPQKAYPRALRILGALLGRRRPYL